MLIIDHLVVILECLKIRCRVDMAAAGLAKKRGAALMLATTTLQDNIIGSKNYTKEEVIFFPPLLFFLKFVLEYVHTAFSLKKISPNKTN
jgi:hypothetical protein